MKVKFKLIDKKKAAKLEKEFYTVLAYGKFDENSKIFLIANDDLKVCNMDERALEVIDNNLEDYELICELNYERIFYVHKNLKSQIVNFENYSELTSNDIWTRSKLATFFIEKNYQIPENYLKSVLNIEYKINLIDGFLMFTNEYINFKNTGDYSDGMYFYVAESFEKIIEERFQDDMKINSLNLNEYKELLMNFICQYLYDQKEKELKSERLCLKLFKLIDSIFIKKITRIFLINSFYDEVFAVEYEEKYYCLSKTWSS